MLLFGSPTFFIRPGLLISRQCLPPADRVLFQYLSHHNLRQFHAISPRCQSRGNLASPEPSQTQQNPQLSRDAEKSVNSRRHNVFRFLGFLVFPFLSHIPPSSLYQTASQHSGIRQRGSWLYRILWLLGIGYTASICLLPSPSSESHGIFSPPRFTPFSIIDRKDISPTSFILTLRPHANTSLDIEPYADSFDRGTWSVEFKQPQLQIARSYTPLPPNTDSLNPSDLQFLIRREQGGEVSNYLANLPLQATVHVRGPFPELDLPRDTTEVVFLAGGTGIAAAMQAAYTLLEGRVDMPKPKIHILWANRKRADCVDSEGISSHIAGAETQKDADGPTPTVRDLRRLQHRHPEHLTIDYFVDEEGTFLAKKAISAATAKAIKENAEDGVGSKLLIVSGPDGFVKFLAGPKKWEDGEEKQGHLGGLVGQLGLKGWQVWKM